MLGYIIMGILNGLLGASVVLLMGQTFLVALTIYALIGTAVTFYYGMNDYKEQTI